MNMIKLMGPIFVALGISVFLATDIVALAADAPKPPSVDVLLKRLGYID